MAVGRLLLHASKFPSPSPSPSPCRPIPRLALRPATRYRRCCYGSRLRLLLLLLPLLPSANLRFRAWHGMAWHGVAAQGGQGLAQKSVSLLALLSGSSRPVFDAAQGDGDRGRGGDWPSSGTHASLEVLLLHALHSQGHALNVPKVPMTTRPKETTVPSQILSGNHLLIPSSL
jgi:hypothetical protein